MQKFLALVDIVTLTGLTFAMTVRPPSVPSSSLLSLVGIYNRLLLLRQADLHEATDGATTWFLAPYCIWLSYATYLNAGYWWLNRNRPELERLK